MRIAMRTAAPQPTIVISGQHLQLHQLLLAASAVIDELRRSMLQRNSTAVEQQQHEPPIKSIDETAQRRSVALRCTASL